MHKYDEYVFPKQREPYTYNTSTYLGMILGRTKEDPKKIETFIKNKVDKIKLPSFKKYNKFFWYWGRVQNKCNRQFTGVDK